MADTDGSESMDQNQDQTETGGAGGGHEGGSSFAPITSQEQFDAMVRDRLRRQRAQYPSDDELKSLRDKAGKFDDLDAASKTELERATQERDAAQQERDRALQALKDSNLRTAVIGEAAKRNVIDPDAALALIDRDSLDLGDDGAPTNIADAMDALLQARPYLVGGGRPAGTADLGARGGGANNGKQLSRDDLKNMTPAQIVEADKNGQLADMKRGA